MLGGLVLMAERQLQEVRGTVQPACSHHPAGATKEVSSVNLPAGPPSLTCFPGSYGLGWVNSVLGVLPKAKVAVGQM